MLRFRWIWAVGALFYALTMRGFDTGEGMEHYALARHFLRTGQLGFAEKTWLNQAQGAGGLWYNAHEFGNTIGMLPFALVQPRDGLEHLFVNLFSVTVAGGILAGFFALATALGAQARRALAAAAILALATQLWPYSRDSYDGMLFGLAMTWAAVFGVRGRVALASALLGFAAITRPSALLFVPLVFWLLRRRPRELALSVAALAPFGLWQLFYNWLRTGNPLVYGIMLPQFSVPFELRLHETIPALLVSPGCGLLVFNPALLAGMGGLRALRRHRYFTVGAAGVALHFVFYALASTWYTYSSWGPRYLVMLLPFLALPLAFCAPRPRWLLAASAALQLLAVSVDHSNLIYFHSEQPDIASVWKPQASEIVVTARELPHVVARDLGLEPPRVWPELKPARQASANYGSYWFVVARAMGAPLWACLAAALGLIASILWTWAKKLRPLLPHGRSDTASRPPT